MPGAFARVLIRRGQLLNRLHARVLARGIAPADVAGSRAGSGGDGGSRGLQNRHRWEEALRRLGRRQHVIASLLRHKAPSLRCEPAAVIPLLAHSSVPARLLAHGGVLQADELDRVTGHELDIFALLRHPVVVHAHHASAAVHAQGGRARIGLPFNRRAHFLAAPTGAQLVQIRAKVERRWVCKMLLPRRSRLHARRAAATPLLAADKECPRRLLLMAGWRALNEPMPAAAIL
mmetsp:Transcript_27433/g.69799  ORF Transcript_27433/g.69799 Transcript_27433/m.69799 type:complete len:233 (+) Transcript_27433:563-1261(+)